MTTFQQKYLKYKTKYLVLKKNIDNQDSNDIFNISNLTDTPVMTNQNINENNVAESAIFSTLRDLNINIPQSGGSNNILEVTNLTDTPVMTNNRQDGGKKLKKINSSSSSSSESVESADSAESTESTGGGKIGKKFLNKEEYDSTESMTDSSDMSLSDSSESILSALEDSDS
jgi:hypothetical protein